MALDFLNYLPQQDFNKILTELYNCDLTAPGYYPGRVPQTFNATQRRSLVPAKDTANNNIFAACGFTEVYDVKLVTSTSIEYYLIIGLVTSATISGVTITNKVAAVRYTLSGTNIGQVTLIQVATTTGRTAGVNYKFFQMTGPRLNGNNTETISIVGLDILYTDFASLPVPSGNGYTNIQNASIVTITGAPLLANINNLNGKILYMYDDATTPVPYGLGYYFKFTSADPYNAALSTDQMWVDAINTSSALNTYNITTGRGYIFDTIGPIWGIVFDDYIYTYHNIDNTNNTGAVCFSAKGFMSPIDADFINGMMVVVTAQGDIVPTARTTSYTMATGLPIISVGGALNIIIFRGYNLIVSNQYIYSLAVIQTTNSDGSIATTTWNPILLTDQFGIFQQNAFRVYNGGLYVLSSHNQRFIAVDIYPVPASTGQYSLVFQDQGAYIQKYLDTISTSDSIRIEVNDQHIYIIRNVSGITTVYIYDMLYKGWHVWQTNLNLLSCRYETFFGHGIYQYNVATGYDIDQTNTDQPYSQQITLLEGESSMFQVKNSKLLKLVIGPNTNVNTVLNATVYIGGQTETYTYLIDSARYMGGPGATTGNALGGSILNEGVLGLGTVAATTSISTPICDLEIPTGFFYQIFKLVINPPAGTGVQFAGLMSGFIILEPQITSPLNVVIEN